MLKDKVWKKDLLIGFINYYLSHTNHLLTDYINENIDKYEQNMQYLHSRNIYFCTIYNMSFYDITYKTLGHKHSVIVTAEEKDEYIEPKKGM